jgi:hypothetical protein
MTGEEVLTFAFTQNYHADKSNAAIHCSPVRFSPLTFRLAEILIREADSNVVLYTAELAEVIEHLGKYREDAGRVAES